MSCEHLIFPHTARRSGASVTYDAGPSSPSSVDGSSLQQNYSMSQPVVSNPKRLALSSGVPSLSLLFLEEVLLLVDNLGFISSCLFVGIWVDCSTLLTPQVLYLQGCLPIRSLPFVALLYD